MWRLAAIAAIVGFGVAAAQPAQPTAATVLANVEHYYANASHVTALFRQVFTDKTFNRTNTTDGRLWAEKSSPAPTTAPHP